MSDLQLMNAMQRSRGAIIAEEEVVVCVVAELTKRWYPFNLK